MDPAGLLQSGDLDGCLAAAQDSVRQDPAAPKARILLFQLLAILGDWKRALNQLAVLGEMDAGSMGMVAAYRTAIQCELLREDVFAGKRSPIVLGEPSDWLASLIEAMRLRGRGENAAAIELRDKAFEDAPESPGEADGRDFAWIADGDTRLGPVLEILIEGRYTWAPFERVAAIELEAPSDLRDAVWMPVQVTWETGGQTVGLIPTRYPGTTSSGDADLMLARKTAWEESGEDFFGLGQRMFATDSGELALMDLRSLRFSAAESNDSDV